MDTPFPYSELKCYGEFHILSYPKERWIKCGSPPFEEFGKMTDGERTPYCEWYDGEKFLQLLKKTGVKQNYKIKKEFNFQDDDFNWIELEHEYTPQELFNFEEKFKQTTISARKEDGDFF